MRRTRRLAGTGLLSAMALGALGADALATHDPARQFTDFVYAPPMWPRVIDTSGRLSAPFIYPLRLEDRLARRYSEVRSRPQPLRWFSGTTAISVDGGEWFPLGTDALGRDVFARLVRGGRVSLGVALVAAAGALLIGLVVGALAGLFGGIADDILMRTSDFIIALPAVYVVLALRAALPLVLAPAQIFSTMVAVLALVGWPFAARGVRAIVAAECRREYAEAARALGAGRTRLLLRHLLPATRGFLLVQATLLLPAFIVAEATLSYVGLGFPDAFPSWGVMLQDAGRGRILVEAPWLAAPVLAIATAVLALNLVMADRAGSSQGLVGRP